MTLRSPLGRVRGLGAAKTGVSHWWAQRLTALALVPLAFWLVASLAALTGAEHAVVSAWVGSPLVAALLILTIAATFYHGFLGLQVVIEDYVHNAAAKLTGLLLVQAASILLALIGVLSVLALLFGN